MTPERLDTVSWDLCRGRTLGPAPFFVVGILNVTPDSFYDGGQAADPDAAVAKGLALLDEGADILDIGGESTRPFSEPVSGNTELARVLPVVQGILAARPDAVLSVDTTKASVARACLEAGALILNDVSAMEADPELLQVVRDFHPGYVLMHSLGRPRTMQVAPQYDDVMAEIMRFFTAKLEILARSGVPESRIVLDPGIGFGKTVEHNLEILKNICKLFEFGRPVYMALSNKSLWGELLGRQGRERNAATLAATVALHERGVRIHRVHEVRDMRDGLAVAHMLGKGTSGEQGC
ncbi:Dihydropteroate synthase [Desulfomicrobium apsheronum]|uniref:Dihydropteroate synthase n=1 Tax=Desulfomicrobium apsheronum TaxID=52560 RepID=A0A1I3ZA33_9BACT|nr:dihydropteroate synthase [Desulfomicrobium apsheronum]SFK40873.1 Dihydropteroate synthase [Desulfomicrobium apsheronum]